jgi:putative ABC transport system permease protein
MFKNYIKTAFRNLLKNKGFTFINVLGLTLGLVVCLLIVFYVFDELSFDRYNTNANRIYRVNMDLKYGGNTSSFAVTQPPLAAAIISTFPEVETTTRLIKSEGTRIKKGNENVIEDKVIYADPSVFDVFTLTMLSGNPKNALKEPNTIVITELAAQKYFNTTSAVGRYLHLVSENKDFKVTGVIYNMPAQSHFNFDYFLSMASLPSSKDQAWNNFAFTTYVLFKQPSNHENFAAKLNALFRQRFGAVNYAQLEKSGGYIKMNLIPLTDIHLQSNRQYELGSNGSSTYVYIFGAIALFILLIACINFMNLSTARSASRAREVGVRKVLGSSRGSLIAQFISESLLITLCAAVIAVFAAWALLPLFNHVSGKELAVSAQLLGWLLPLMVLIIIVVGVLAGSYPAFYLSGFRPINVLKGKLSTGFKGSGFRNFLVVLQFSISVFLIIGTLVIYRQLNYIAHRDLGFNRSQVLVIKHVDILDNATILKQEIKRLPGVSNATLSGFIPTGTLRAPDAIFANKTPDAKNALFTEIWPIDEDYLNTMGMKLATGRNFSAQLISDSSNVIINETAARMLGCSNNPLNKKLYRVPGPGKPIKEYSVIGVVKDFNFSSLRDNITPVVMLLGKDKGALSVRIDAKNLNQYVSRIENTWNNISPNEHFQYSFMDEDFNAAYHLEQRTGTLVLLFTIFALIIASLGLFGLVAYAAEQRTREIGIRKVLGADVSTVIILLSKDFIKLVFIAIIIATPLAWLAMQKWLQSFAYRESIHWWIFAVTGAGALLIAFITMSFQSIKAALANPVNSLRSE